VTEQAVIWRADGGVRVLRDGALFAEAGPEDAMALVRGLPALSAPVPATVPLSRLLFALTGAGFISRDEALAAARTGALPASLADVLIADLDADTAFQVELLWAAMYEAERASPFWDLVMAAGIATSAQIDDVFRAAGA
jgi:hypothetical protein